MNTNEQFIWVEKYRPQTVEETILPDTIKKIFKDFVKKGDLQNLLLAGGAGIGKTTIARALLNEIGADYIVINGSLERGIDVLRTTIAQFATTVSFTGGRKFIIIDEADNLTHDAQRGLRAHIEDFSANCGFILTCNFKNKIIEPLHSRTSVVDFKVSKEEMPNICGQFFKRICGILDDEGVPYDRPAVAALIKQYYPDWRRTLNELQRYAATGKIDEGILKSSATENLEDLFAMMRAKDFTQVRQWIGLNSDMDSAPLYRSLYDTMPALLADTQSVAAMVVILAEYQYKEAFVADVEVNRAAAFATLMAEMSWK